MVSGARRNLVLNHRTCCLLAAHITLLLLLLSLYHLIVRVLVSPSNRPITLLICQNLQQTIIELIRHSDRICI